MFKFSAGGNNSTFEASILIGDYDLLSGLLQIQGHLVYPESDHVNGLFIQSVPATITGNYSDGLYFFHQALIV